VASMAVTASHLELTLWPPIEVTIEYLIDPSNFTHSYNGRRPTSPIFVEAKQPPVSIFEGNLHRW